MDAMNPKSQEALDRESSDVRPGRTSPNNLRDQMAVEEGDRLWPTPSATPRGPHTGREFHNNQTFSKTTGTSFGMTLETATRHWPTPSASSGGTHTGISQETAQKELERGNQIGLGAAASLWPTPTTQEYPHEEMEVNEKGRRKSKKGDTSHSLNLQDSVSLAPDLWPTPNPRDTRRGCHQRQLATEVELWPTPTASEEHAGTNPNGLMQEMLGNHPDVRGQGLGTLNPSWVGWLMGLPINWEALEPLSREDFDAWLEHQRNGTWWDEERGLPRVSRGVSKRVNRLRACGNGIVPASATKFIALIGFTGEEL